MTARKSITAAWARDVLIRQAFAAGHPIPCALCGKAMLPGQPLTLEHLHALALGGLDGRDNTRYAHKECAKRKTHGTKATTAGSDIHMMAKAKRIAKGGRKRRGPKIPSRPFPDVHRPLRS